MVTPLYFSGGTQPSHVSRRGVGAGAGHQDIVVRGHRCMPPMRPIEFMHGVISSNSGSFHTFQNPNNEIPKVPTWTREPL